MTNATTEVKAIVKGQDELTPEFKKAEKSVKNFGSEVNKTSKNVNNSLARMAQATKKFGDSAVSFGRSAAINISAPIVAAMGVGIREFAKLDSAINKSAAIMSGVTDQMKGEMKELAEKLSVDLAISTEKLGESYYFLASAGLDAQQSLAALPAVATFAKAGMFDMSLATDLLTDAQSALGLTVQDSQQNLANMTKVGDIFVKANTLANASVQQFSEAITNEAGTAMRQYNIDLENGVAVLAAYADQGIKGNVAGSLFGRAIRLLTKAAMDNQEEFKKMNIQVFDAKGEFRDFQLIAADLENALGGLSTEQRSVALETLGFSARTQQAILPLIGMSDQIKEYDQALRDAGGTTQMVADKQMQSFTEEMKSTWNQIKITAAGFSEQLIPAIREVGEIARKTSDYFNGLTDKQKKFIAEGAVLVAAIAPISIGLGVMAKSVSTLIVLTKDLTLALKFLIANPLVLLVAAVAAAGAAFYVFSKDIDVNMTKIHESVNTMVMNSRASIQQNIQDHVTLSQNIGEIEKAIVEAKRDGSVQIVANKKEELRVLLELEKKGAEQRLQVQLAEFNAMQSKRAEVVSNIRKLEERQEGFFGFVGGEERSKNIVRLKNEATALAGQAQNIGKAMDQIQQMGQQQELSLQFKGINLEDKEAPKLQEFTRVTVPPTIGGDATEDSNERVQEKQRVQQSYFDSLNNNLGTLQDNNQTTVQNLVQDSEKQRIDITDTKDVHGEAIQSMIEANNNLTKNIESTVKKSVSLYDKLRGMIQKIKAITAPVNEEDRRSLKDVSTQFGITDPTAGSFIASNLTSKQEERSATVNKVVRRGVTNRTEREKTAEQKVVTNAPVINVTVNSNKEDDTTLANKISDTILNNLDFAVMGA